MGTLAPSFLKAFSALLLVAGVVCWWLVLTHKSRQVAQEESNRQTHALMREIELHRQTDEQLQQAKRAADAANQAKSRYITAISHELRTPLNSILGYAQLLEEDDTMPAHRRNAVRVIRRGGDHLLSLIEGTLDVARIESGKLALDAKPLRLRECLEEIAHLFELQAAGRGIAFEHRVEGALPEFVRVDEKRLRQILINLLGNAVKFTQQGRVQFRVSHQREMARFEIEDSGPGMTEEELSQVFEPFTRGSSAGAAAAGGTGLGLTIARMLVNLMGGEMKVTSTPGVGSVFTIRLFMPEASAGSLSGHTALRRVGYAGERRRVLTVDNEEADRGLIASALEPIGFEVMQAASGEECLAMVQALRPDVIFMDLAMPGIDGWETIRRLRAGGYAGALAVVSANAFDKGLENDAGIAPADFLVKPVRVSELLDWLGRSLSLKWLEGTPSIAVKTAQVPSDFEQLPAREHLEALAELAKVGYLRGIAKKLDQIEAEDATAARFVAQLRLLAQQFQIDALNGALRKALAHDEPRRLA